VFAGQEVALQLEVVNPSRYARYTITAGLPGMHGGAEVVDEIPAGKGAWTTLHFPAPRRGTHEAPFAVISSAWPVGAFKSARLLDVQQSFLVYPKPGGSREFPRGGGADPRADRAPGEGDDFIGARAYVAGESQRHVDWKAVARGQPMLTKQFASGNGGDLHFDYSALPVRGIEPRLSQLALWVVEAERARRRYSLRLPGKEIPAAHGEHHYHQCLEALALFQ
jgi:uncharacterized protein (DUF58 family)